MFSDLKMILKIFLICLVPIRLIQLTKLYLNIKMKFKRKRSQEDNILYDLEFSEKMHKYVNEIIEELKKDASSAFAILIILFGVF
jgi:hypothetical protein